MQYLFQIRYVMLKANLLKKTCAKHTLVVMCYTKVADVLLEGYRWCSVEAKSGYFISWDATLRDKELRKNLPRVQTVNSFDGEFYNWSLWIYLSFFFERPTPCLLCAASTAMWCCPHHRQYPPSHITQTECQFSGLTSPLLLITSYRLLSLT